MVLCQFSRPYPLDLYPPNGDAGETARYVLIHTVPASSARATLWALCKSRVPTPAASPYGTAFAVATASSSVSNRTAARTGPKISSCPIRLELSTFVKMVGSK